MFGIKVITQPDRSRQEAIKARIKDRRKTRAAQADADNYSTKQTFQQEKDNANS